MARVLLGWELGAGRGHVVSMLAMGEALMRRGHQVGFALQRFEALPARLPVGALLFQSPLWPRLLSSDAPKTLKPAVTMVDILARLGLETPGCLARLISAWDGILASFAPQLVITDYAPALLVTAHGRVPTIATGPGFQVAPSEVARVARFEADEPGYDEPAMLDIVDAELRETGREPLPALPALFRATRPMIASFAELDPHERPAEAEYIAPIFGGSLAASEGQGDEVFVYANGPHQRMAAFWQGLAATGLPVRAYVPVNDETLARQIARAGIRVERKPLPWPLIAARSRVIVNHGAHGVMCGALLAGIPQLALPLDLEKRLHSAALARTGLGLSLPEAAKDAAALSDAVRVLHADSAMGVRARAAAPGFVARIAKPFEEAIADGAEALLQ